MLDAFDKEVPDELKPSWFKERLAEFGGVKTCREALYANTLFTDRAKVAALTEKDRDLVLSDPAYRVYDAFYRWYYDELRPVINDVNREIRLAYRDYMQGQMDFEKDKAFYPDANLTLRVAYGHVEGYSPADGIDYYPVSTLKGIIEKDNPDIYDYNIPQTLRDLYAKAKQDKREEVSVSKLRVGLKCGGSDGFSGITANPLVGEFSDWLVAQGGTSILTEVPEMFGAETILMNRCETPELFDKTVSMINNFKNYFLSHGEPVGENPSPGNKAGGISTLEDKALGCTQKCGKAPVSGVMEYGDRLEHTGLNLLSAPGNDLVESTALASAGCHIVLFTTGRGTPFGTFVPTMKIATNPTLAKNKPHWVDFSAGQLVEGRTMQELVPEFIDKVLAVASGEPARNEENGYREISIFKNGVTL